MRTTIAVFVRTSRRCMITTDESSKGTSTAYNCACDVENLKVVWPVRCRSNEDRVLKNTSVFMWGKVFIVYTLLKLLGHVICSPHLGFGASKGKRNPGENKIKGHKRVIRRDAVSAPGRAGCVAAHQTTDAPASISVLEYVFRVKYICNGVALDFVAMVVPEFRRQTDRRVASAYDPAPIAGKLLAFCTPHFYGSING
ncbi:hypothetical protein EVAR_60197_1 [Eumeta japonica]|uniref:Uncharacterized protein n=1 Tax=Eumeta variegata TaxID=151549 RepID=A0A4C1ZAQ1_EUMVA|nr:hypothetical protein EVAR_60197_1 [Eumeta japonica]